MDYTTENLEKVVNLFYRSEAGQQAQAHQWLTEAQNSPQAWSFVWELLHPQRNCEVQFYAATTLHTKLLKYWNEVPDNYYEELKNKIVQAIINYAMGPKIVLNRLCIALSAYIIHTLPYLWPNAFEELVSSFQPQNLPNIRPERVNWILLEILTVVPEEFHSTSLPSAQKIGVRNVLENVLPNILRVIEMFLTTAMNEDLNSNNITTFLNATRCAAAWLQFQSVCISECENLMNFLIQFLRKVYWNPQDSDGLSSEELEYIEAATEVLSTIICHSQSIKYPLMINKFFFENIEFFLEIIQNEQRKKDPNKDVLGNIYGLIITSADNHSKLLIDNLLSDKTCDRNLSLLIFKAILNCSNMAGTYPVDENSSILTFPFWYTLQDDVMALDTQNAIVCQDMIKPFYRNLVPIIMRKSMFPSSEENKHWTSDDKEVFRCYRQDIADTLMYCYSVLNVELLYILNNKLNETMEKCKNNEANIYKLWPELESCLHAFYAVAEQIDTEDVYIPKLMYILKDIPYEKLHTKVFAMALDTFGAYAEWITDHPEILEHVIPFLTSGLSKQDVAPSATLALKDLTNNCQKFLGPFSNHILQACQEALQSNNLRLAECIRIMFSVGKVLSIIPLPNIMHYLDIVFKPYFEEVQILVTMEENVTVTTTLVSRLKIISALFCALHVKDLSTPGDQQPTLIVSQCTMPLYKAIAAKWCKNTEIMEVFCTMLSHIVTSLLDDCKPIAEDIVQILLSCFRNNPQSCIISTLKIIIILLGKESGYVELMQTVLSELVSITIYMCACLTENGVNLMSEQADVIESFFGLLTQILKKNCKLLSAKSINLTGVFHCAIICLSMAELPLMKSSTSYLCNFILQSKELNAASIIDTSGEQVVGKILINIGGAAPRSSIEPMSDLLLVLNKKYCEYLAVWLNYYLTQEGFPSPKITKEQKEIFVKSVIREKVNRRKLIDLVLEFSLTCRGIVRQENIA